jgi:serine/threonine-protein kinase
MSLLTRLKERKLVQWAVAYLAGAWVLLQVMDVVAEPWGLSSFLLRSIQVTLVAGLFVTLVLAWYHGEQGRQRVSGMELLILAAVLFTGGTLLALIQPSEDDQASLDPDVLEPPLGLDDDRPSVAALPFANRSGVEDDRYFTDGLHDEIITRLSTVSAMRVIARTSVEEYRETPKSVRVIGEELGVRYLLAGGVRPSRTPSHRTSESSLRAPRSPA